MPELIPVLSKEEIDKLVYALAQKISSDYNGHTLVLIGVLKGAFIFLADLLRYLTIPVEVEFLRAASYGSGTASSGKVQLTSEIGINLKNRDILIVEDIIDTGLTVDRILRHLKSHHPRSLKTCTFIDKHERRTKEIAIDYACYQAQEGFLVGYGLDYNENYRHLPELYHLKL